jgi:hypothetical protein
MLNDAVRTGCFIVYLTNEEIKNLHSSSNIIILMKSKEDKIAGECSTHAEKRNAYRVLVGKPEGK